MNPHPWPFAKPIQQLSLADLQLYFSEERTENQYLEFKSGEVTIDKILKEVGAFLNAEGGVLIIGAPRELERPHNAGICIGELTYSAFDSEETLKSYLTNDIIPPPPKLHISQLQDEQYNVFVIDIPASSAAPHMVLRNGKYYIRDGDMSRPARHREVEKMFTNRQQGNLSLQLSLEVVNQELKLSVSLQNLSSKTAERVGYQVLAKPVRNGKEMLMEKIYDQPLYQHQFWENTVNIPFSQETVYIQVDCFGADLLTKTKSAFVAIHGKRTELLATYYSEDINAPHPKVFFETHRYLLD